MIVLFFVGKIVSFLFDELCAVLLCSKRKHLGFCCVKVDALVAFVIPSLDSIAC